MEDILKTYGSLVRLRNLATDYCQFCYPMPSFEFDFWAKYLPNTHENLIQYTFDSKEYENHQKNSQNVIFHGNFKVKGAMTSTKKVVFGRKLKSLGHLR